MKRKILKIISKVLIIPFFINRILERRRIRKEILKDGNPDFKGTANNIILSMKLSKELHRELITKIHSDKIYDEDKKSKADDLAAKVNLARRNYSELTKLKIEIENFLLEL